MKTFLSVALILLCLSAGVRPLRAEEPAEHSEQQKEKEEGPLQVAWKWVNLVLLLGGIGYLLKKPAREFFENRHKEITAGLERAKAAQEESQRRMKEIESKLNRLSAEISSLRTQADAESEQERATVLADAKRDVERLIDQSRQEIDRIARGIERDIKVKIADAVIEHAGRALETQMTEDDQKRVVVRFLNKV
jgi:F-type H+-transporting ATPase subunit b